MKVKCDHRSKFSNLSNWKEEAWKKSGLQRDSNPWPPRYRCDALPTELWSHTLGARSIYWVHFFPCSEIMWNIYGIIHICTAVWDLSNWKEEAWKKKSGLQRDSNPWPPRYRCDASSFQLLKLENLLRWSHFTFISYRSTNMNHGFESRWSPDFFQASSFQLLKLENLLRWSHFTFTTYNANIILTFTFKTALLVLTLQVIIIGIRLSRKTMVSALIGSQSCYTTGTTYKT